MCESKKGNEIRKWWRMLLNDNAGNRKDKVSKNELKIKCFQNKSKNIYS